MNYRQALKTPKCGWKYAPKENMIAQGADMLYRAHCLNPEPIFVWAKRHEIDLSSSSVLYALTKLDSGLMECVLMDTVEYLSDVVKKAIAKNR